MTAELAYILQDAKYISFYRVFYNGNSYTEPIKFRIINNFIVVKFECGFKESVDLNTVIINDELFEYSYKNRYNETVINYFKLFDKNKKELKQLVK